MRGLSASQLLRAWENGLGRSAAGRALALLAESSPGMPEESLARLSLGQRDALLMEARAATFGPVWSAYTECPRCGERLEFPLDPAGDGWQSLAPAPEPIREFTEGGVT